MKNKGFTLIELLAVIVILAILMVIAVPKILDVIESSRSSAAESSIKLIKEGIKTNVAAAELTTNPFTKTDGCYLFDFDTPNTNVNNLDIDNKEKAGGSIKLCNGKFSDDTLTFDGNSSSTSIGDSFEANYIQKEYIKSTGTQYIDTEVNPTNNTNFEIELKTDVDSLTEIHNSVFFGSNDSTINKIISFNFGDEVNHKYIYLWKNASYAGGGSIINFSTVTYNPVNKIKIASIDNVWKVNDNVIGTAQSVGDWIINNSSLVVFGFAVYNGENTVYPFQENMYLYSLKIWDGSTLVRDYVPCVKKSNNSAGLYDLVNNKFYSNNGTGTFTTN